MERIPNPGGSTAEAVPVPVPVPQPPESGRTAHSGLDRRVLLGIGFVCLAGLLFPVMNAMAKLLGAHYPSVQVSWARAFGHIVFMLAAFMPRQGFGMLRTRRPGVQLLRSAMLFSSNLCFFYAVTFIPLAKAAAISMTAPLIVALLAWPMLGERTTPGRVLALAVGFLGVLIVIRPGTAVFHWASIFVVVSASCYGVYQILTRRIASIDSPETSAIYSSLVGAFATLAVMPFIWVPVRSVGDALMFCSLGTLGALGHYCIARAMTYAPANIVSPFQYFQLLGSVAVGFLVFGDMPDALTWLGAGVIVACGLWIGLSQARTTRRAATRG